jgi:site-specific DNA-adenine methylase
MKEYLSSPLPFVGQKRMFAGELKKVLFDFPEDSVFVDLFGGSGLLSHITKRQCPRATVVYNDFDNYRQRLENIPKTNKLLRDFRAMLCDIPHKKLIPADMKERMLERIKEEEATGFVDYITVSSGIMFSMKYQMSLEGLRKESFYNNIRKNDYAECDDYLEGLTIVSCDYKELYNQYKNVKNVVFFVDPPYLSTDVSTYRMSWSLRDYLDVLTVLQGHSYVYFTSNKSSIIELCDWMGKNREMGNPFDDCIKKEFNAHMNYNSCYTDIMLYKRET